MKANSPTRMSEQSLDLSLPLPMDEPLLPECVHETSGCKGPTLHEEMPTIGSAKTLCTSCLKALGDPRCCTRIHSYTLSPLIHVLIHVYSS